MAPSSKLLGPAKWSELFPTRLSLVVFIMYMAHSIVTGLVVTASRKGGSSYSFKTTLVVFFTEFVKLIASFVFYVQSEGIRSFFPEVQKNFKLFALYFIPSALYCLYNNLTFINLANYDPTTYFLLHQMRIVVTGIIFQVLFKKRLSGLQWTSLVILTVGCVVKHLGSAFTSGSSMKAAEGHGLSFASDLSAFGKLGLILVQVFCSCFAGVYNEYLLKDAGSNVNVMIQNVFMYTDSLFCNFSVLLFLSRDSLGSVFNSDDIVQLFSNAPAVIIIFNNAALGIVTSLFLRSLNAVLKTFASALEVIFTAFLSLIFFGIPVDIYTCISICIVIGASAVYASNPIVNPGKIPLDQSKVPLDQVKVDSPTRPSDRKSDQT